MTIRVGIVNKLVVFKNDKHIGYGYLITWPHYSERPLLFSKEGIELPEAWYDIVMTSELNVIVESDVLQ